MAFADLMLGTLTLPIYIYLVGKSFQLWNGGSSTPMLFFYLIVVKFFSQASLISAAFVSARDFTLLTGRLCTEHCQREHTVLLFLLCGY